MIYRKKADYKVAVARTKSGEAIQVNQMVAPSHLNPHIRGLRLAFVLLFCFMDIGYALYLVSDKKRKREVTTTEYSYLCEQLFVRFYISAFHKKYLNDNKLHGTCIWCDCRTANRGVHS